MIGEQIRIERSIGLTSKSSDGATREVAIAPVRPANTPTPTTPTTRARTSRRMAPGIAPSAMRTPIS
jgi:hypothetical protein